MDVKLVSEGGEYISRHRFEFPEDELLLLEHCHGLIERLRACSFVQNGRGGSISFRFVGTGPPKANYNFHEDELSTLLLRIRPFVLQNEDCYFFKITRKLGRRLHAVPAFKNQLKLLNSRFNLVHFNWKTKPGKYDRQLFSRDVVMDWLNAFEYHTEPGKVKNIKLELGAFGEDQDGRPIIVFILVDLVQAILNLGDLIETILRSKNGEIEISCPPEWILSE